jgi:aminoglycoside phosphotransferase (APT) family kinase protein
MSDPIEHQRFAQIAHCLEPHSRLRRLWPLTGGVSAQVTALELERPDGSTHRMVVRRHGEVDRRANPQIAADEFKLLQHLQAANLPAPKPFYLDQSETIFETPYLVIEYIEGAAEFAPTDLTDFIRQFTTTLSSIHGIRRAKADLSFLPDLTEKYGQRFDQGSTAEGVDAAKSRSILAAAWPFPSLNQAVLLHGDFWPGNLLWHNGRLAAVIDWEDALVGDPLADVANSRLELLWAFGQAAMDLFTAEYQLSMADLDFTNLPYWDLWAAWRKPASKVTEWGLDEATVQAMQAGHHGFVTQAFEKLPT